MTVGAAAALTVTVVVAVLDPALFVAVSVRFTVVCTATNGAVNTGVAIAASENVPAVADHANVGVGVPVAEPARVRLPPEATV